MKLWRFADIPFIYKIGFAPAFALVMLGGLALFVGWSQVQQEQVLQSVVKDTALRAQIATDSQRITAANAALYTAMTAQAAGGNAAATQTALNGVMSQIDGVTQDLTTLRPQLPGSEQAGLDQSLKDLAAYRGGVQVVGSMLSLDFASAANFLQPFGATYVRMTTTLSQVSQEITDSTTANAHASEEEAGKIKQLLLALALLTLVTVSFVSVVIVRAIRGSINDISAATEHLAAGNRDTDIARLARKDELGAIVRSLDVFKDNQQHLEQMRTTQAAQEAREKDIREAQQRQSEEESAQQAMVVNFLADGLERLSTGDLMLRLETEFPPGYEKLRQDFNSAIGTLRKTMQDIAVNAGGVQSGAIAITQSSDDITQRTEQQAARLEETAAALDEITTAVRKTASGAHAARDVVNAAKEDAERSGAVLNQTVIAMSGIETSSRQISNIIGVIDEIAFQTNLLALNAGVEAARAGDAGRGFAVVATEVRALAQRSADAAKEIKALISTSGAQVQTGVKLVAETSQALGRIVEQVTRLNILVNDIAASAQEQATGVAGVNEAVGMVDRVTQQNASKVTESASSAHALAGEARELVRLVGQFRIDTLVPAAAAWATPTSPPATRLAKPMATPARRPTTSPAPGRFAAVTESWDEF